MRLPGTGPWSTRLASVVLALTMSLLLPLASACSDHDEDHDKKHKKESRREENKQAERQMIAPVSAAANAAYKQECGGCHHAYFPGLLPVRSWEKMFANPSDHFGEQLPFAGSDLAEVRAYLSANAADVSSSKLSRKIMKSIGSSTPLRISEIAYIVGKHHEVSSEVFKRKSVGGLSNCVACHKGAETGDFNDDDAVIPK